MCNSRKCSYNILIVKSQVKMIISKLILQNLNLGHSFYVIANHHQIFYVNSTVFRFQSLIKRKQDQNMFFIEIIKYIKLRDTNWAAGIAHFNYKISYFIQYIKGTLNIYIYISLSKYSSKLNTNKNVRLIEPTLKIIFNFSPGHVK